VFCDDLSFDKDDTSASRSAVLEGGIERPENVVLRHLQLAPPDVA
jgi:predicted AAA+ superfamily ATPase